MTSLMEIDIIISRKRPRELTLRETGLPPKKVPCIQVVPMEVEYEHFPDPIDIGDIGPPPRLLRSTNS